MTKEGIWSIMGEYTVKVKDLIEGMLLSKDVLNKDGVVLLPKDTILYSNHILKLHLYQIKEVQVYEGVDESANIDNSAFESDTILISETPEFISFANRYTEQATVLGMEFDKIIKAKEINTDNLISIIDNLSTKFASNYHILSYLCRIKTEDNITYSHCINVSILAAMFSKWLHLNQEDTRNLSLAGLLHDIGKMEIDQRVVNKPDSLTYDELQEMKKHPILGYELIWDSDLDSGIKQVVLSHHERMNGSGYPSCPKWSEVHDYVKIISIIDIFDAMTSSRSYRHGVHPFKAIQYLEEECLSILDTKYLFTFLDNIAHNYIGNDVLLSTGEKGKIAFINPQSPSHPIVQTKTDFIDLLTVPSVKIKNFI